MTVESILGALRESRICAVAAALFLYGCETSPGTAPTPQSDCEALIRNQRAAALELVQSPSADVIKFLSNRERLFLATAFDSPHGVSFNAKEIVSQKARVPRILFRYVQEADESHTIRKVFLWLLGRMRATEMTPDLIKMVDETKSKYLREWAMVAIGLIGDDRGKAFLSTITDPSHIVLLSRAIAGDGESEKDFLRWFKQAMDSETKSYKEYLAGDHSPLRDPQEMSRRSLGKKLSDDNDVSLLLMGTSYLRSPDAIMLLIEATWLRGDTLNPGLFALELLKNAVPEIPISQSPREVDERYEFLTLWWSNNRNRLKYDTERRVFEIAK